MHLIGLDVGYSKRKKTNALAEIRSGELRVVKMSVDERDHELARLRDVDVIAIDAPIVPFACDPGKQRTVEQVFSRGAFQKRCKPGMSHVRGTGQLLREHGARSARLIAEATLWSDQPPFETVILRHGIVEAFPNAFLGVVLEDDSYAARPSIARGHKFDWLFDQWIACGLFAGAVTLSGLPLQVAEELHRERDHDKRAALICLLTAAFALTGHAESIGDEDTGYFVLPPLEMWSRWAREEIARLHHGFGLST